MLYESLKYESAKFGVGTKAKIKVLLTGRFLSFPFKDGHEYRVFVAAWKGEYKALTQMSRQAKEAAANLSRAGKYAGEAQASVNLFRAHARKTLELRRDAKVEAQRLWKEETLSGARAYHAVAAQNREAAQSVA